MDTKAVKYKDGLPILPGAFPIVGHIPAFFRNSIETLCKGHQALGPLFWLRLGFNPLDTQWILTCSGEEGFELLTNQKKARKYVGSTPTILVGESTDWDGATHRRLRTAMGKAFSPRAMTTGQVGNLTADLIASYVNRWVEGRRLPIAREARALTLDIVFRVIGADVADLPEWRKQYHELMLAAYGISIMLPGFPMYRAAKARKWMDARFTSMMNEARGGARAGSFLHTLVTSTDESGQPIPDVDLIDGLRLLGLAAHDSTASMMSWQLIMMAREPKYWDAVLAEAENAAVPTSSDELRQFPFAEGMFREAIRLYSPALFLTRQANEELTLYHHRIAADTLLGISLGDIARDPVRYPNPELFDPTRWLSRSGQLTPMDTAPFGGGPHFCLGYHLAWMESVQFVVTMAKALSAKGLRPRLPDGPGPRLVFAPVAQPNSSAQIDFV